jgi:hypothetical protein
MIIQMCLPEVRWLIHLKIRLLGELKVLGRNEFVLRLLRKWIWLREGLLLQPPCLRKSMKLSPLLGTQAQQSLLVRLLLL